MKPKILLYDLEVSPNVSYTWGGSLYEQNVIDVKRTWELLSVAYKWLGDTKVTCITRQGEKTDKHLTKKLHKLFDEADIIVAHNAAQFDNKKSCAKFAEHGLLPPTPYKTVDTLQVAKLRFSFNSNKLDELGKLFNLGRKERIEEGFDLWLKVMADDAAAWKKMISYNIQDVVLLEKVYLKLRPWMDKHPHVALNVAGSCPKCGSITLQSRGYGMNAQGKYRKLQCMSCGGWCSSRLAVEKAKHTTKNIG